MTLAWTISVAVLGTSSQRQLHPARRHAPPPRFRPRTLIYLLALLHARFCAMADGARTGPFPWLLGAAA